MTRQFESALLALMSVLIAGQLACSRTGVSMTEVQRVSTGDLDVVFLSPADALHHGMDAFTIEFRSKADAHVVDVGDVRARASMAMPGSSPMFGTVEIMRTSVAGRYAASSEFGMAGTWRTTIEWNGPQGKGSVTFSATVQ